MGRYEIEWGDFYVSEPVGSPANTGSSSNTGSNGSGSSDDGFDVSGNFIGEGWGGNPPPPPPPPDSAETDTDGNYTSALYQFEAAEVAAAQAAAQAAAAEEEKKKTLAKQLADKGKEIALAAQSAIMGGPAKTGIIKSQFQQAGKHKLRAQYDYLKAKYGDKWAETTQAKSLANYLSGVPVERGGGLGARDETYGGGPTENIDPEMEEKRQWLLGGYADQISTYMKYGDIPDDYWDQTKEEFGADLTDEQWFNFRQQLMASDPTPGNVTYKEAFPWSSGAALPAIGKFLLSPALSITKDILGIESVAPA